MSLATLDWHQEVRNRLWVKGKAQALHPISICVLWCAVRAAQHLTWQMACPGPDLVCHLLQVKEGAAT